jgi:predicted acyltransferase
MARVDATDLNFPFFLYMVGVSLAFSIVPRLEAGANRTGVVGKIARRSLIIIALGLFLAGFPRFHIPTMRFPGVLQRIGLVYCVPVSPSLICPGAGSWQ